MAGKHILKLLIEENAKVSIGVRQLTCEFTPTKHGRVEYIIIKPYKKTRKKIFITNDEQEACRVLKGE